MAIGMNGLIVRLGQTYGELSSFDNAPTMFGRCSSVKLVGGHGNRRSRRQNINHHHRHRRRHRYRHRHRHHYPRHRHHEYEPHGVNVMGCACLLQATGNRYTNLSTPETGLVKPATGLLYGRLPAVE